MDISSKPAEGHVLFWLTEEDGREFATCGASEFRAAMRERDELRAEVERLRAAIEQTWRPEVNALRASNKRLEARLDQILTLANLE